MLFNHGGIEGQLLDILDGSKFKLSDISPSDWAELNMVVKKGNFPGPLSYNRTPYSRGIIDTLSPYYPIPEITLMGGSQWGKTVSVIEPAIAFLISEHPSEMAYMTGHSNLSDEAMDKLDSALDNSGVGKLIRKISLRKNNRRTGDTSKYKEFAGGSLISGSATNHKMLRQRAWRFVFPDDIEAANVASKQSGDTVSMIRARTASFGRRRKIFWCSSPELEETSIINPLYLSGDQRRYLIPCQKCGVFIWLDWEIDIVGTDGKEKGGIVWKTDETGKLKRGSVEYVCQVCGKAFNERNKYEFNLAGYWQATAIPTNDEMASFHLSRLYAQPGQTGWEDNVRQYLAANPSGGRIEHLHKPFVNQVLGLPYKALAQTPKATAIMSNAQSYDIGIVPEKLSISHGNGRIVLLTLSSDLNGTVDDARIDYEVKAHAENGATYSVLHGSIGTFVSRENQKAEKADRKAWTYEFGRPNSVWPVYDKIIRQAYKGDNGLFWKVNMPGVDVGHLADKVYPYIDWTINTYPGNPVVGLRGHREEKYIAHGDNLKLFSVGSARADIYYLQVGLFKDMAAANMQIKWQPGDGNQPPNFMNFPHAGKYICPVKKEFHDKLGIPYDGDYLYDYPNYFQQFESEHRVPVEEKSGKVTFRWVKTASNVSNHFWDCHIYNMALREIIVKDVAKQLGEKLFEWPDYVAYVLS